MADLDLRGIRVYIDVNVHHVYEDLVSRSLKDVEARPFATMKDVFVMAACLGVRYERFQELGTRRDIFAGDAFDPKLDAPVLASLAYRHTGNVETISDPKEIVAIAEKWAQGGIEILQQQLTARVGLAPLYRLIDMVLHETGVGMVSSDSE